jgi:hypothetical protein
MDISIEEAISHVRVVDEARNYWFIRTFSGALYETFQKEDFIGIGFNNVPYEYLKNGRKSSEDFNKLKTFIEDNTNYEKGEATKWANQLLTFENDVIIGDVVIIPSEGSNELAIGVIESNTKIVKSERTFKLSDGRIEFIPEKRKNIQWIKNYSKENLLGEMNSLFSSHQAITKANKYSDIIEGRISNLFIKNNQMHLVIKINQDEDINAFDLNRFLDNLTYFYKEYCIENGIEYNEELFIKIKLQSKGNLYLKAAVYAGVFAIAIIISLSQNPEIKIESPILKASYKSNGDLLSNISKFLNENQERRHRNILFNDSIAKLKAESAPETISDTSLFSNIEGDTSNKIGDDSKVVD